MKLGELLQESRERRGLTLRAAEKATGISNAYLSQVETGKIQQPSPVVLHKLSELYALSYPELLEKAGYPVPDRSEDSPGYTRLASRLGPLMEDEEQAVIEYVEFLRSRRKQGRAR